MFKQTPGAPQPFIGKCLNMSASWWNCYSIKLWQVYLPLRGHRHEGHYGGSSHLMSAKNVCSQNQMGVRWPPLFWADLSLQRVTRHHTFLWSQPASYHGGQSKMWKRHMTAMLHKWHICSSFISSFLCYYIPPVVVSLHQNKNRVDKSRKQIDNTTGLTKATLDILYISIIEWCEHGLQASRDRRNMYAGYRLQLSIFRKSLLRRYMELQLG